MDESTTTHFVRQLTEHQNRLFGYVYSLLGDRSRAADVVQETNLVLWRKLDEFQPDKPFLPWAFAIARFQVLAHLRDQKRDRLLADAELIEALDDEAQRLAEDIDAVRDALQPCLKSLTAGNRALIESRYFRGVSIEGLAESTQRTAGAIKVALLRIRRQLAECIEKRLAAES